MKLFNVAFGLHLFFAQFLYVFSESLFALNSYVCHVMKDSIFATEVILHDQTETSYDVAIEFTDREEKFQTVITHDEFQNVEPKLCTHAFIYDKMLDEIGAKSFSEALSITLETDLNFVKVEDQRVISRSTLINEINELIELEPDNLFDIKVIDVNSEELIEVGDVEVIEEDVIEL